MMLILRENFRKMESDFVLVKNKHIILLPRMMVKIIKLMLKSEIYFWKIKSHKDEVNKTKVPSMS